MADPVSTFVVRSIMTTVIHGIASLFGRDKDRRCPTLQEIEHARNNKFVPFQADEIGFLGVPDAYYDALTAIVNEGGCNITTFAQKAAEWLVDNRDNQSSTPTQPNTPTPQPPPVYNSSRPDESDPNLYITELKDFIIGNTDDLENALDEIEANILGSIVSSNNQNRNAIADTRSDVLIAIQEAIGLVTSRNDNAIQDAKNVIGGAINGTNALINASQNYILDRLGSIIGGAENSVTGAIINQTGGITNDISRVSSQLDSFANSFDASIGGVLDVAGSILDFVSGGFKATINNKIVIPDSVFGVITAAMQDILDGVLKNTGGILEVVVDTIMGGIRGLIGAQVVAAEAETAVLIDIAEAITKNKDIDSESFKDIAKGEFFKIITKDLDPVTRDEILDAARINIGYTLPPNCNFDDVLEQIKVPGPQEDQGADLMSAMTHKLMEFTIWLVSSAMTPLTIASAKAQANLNAWALCPENSFLFLQPGDAIAAYQRGLITEEAVTTAVKSAGYTLEDAQALIGTGFTVPNIELLYSMNLRGLLDESGFDQALNSLGYSDAWLENLKELKFFIPPVQDLITMAVREVFSPETAERFGQFEDFPEDFKFWAEKQGVDERWARNYWAAHWALPSVQMGYEMLHRGVINDADLDLLLKAQDVMPFWREKLKEISYSPLTRVDVRRMHKVGVLTEEEVYQSYLNIGYNPENAERMKNFTVEVNNEDESLLDEELEGLTRSNLIGFYKDGTLNRDETFTLLLAIGMPVVSSELFLDNADYELEAKERKRIVNLTLDKLKNESISPVDARAAISDLEIQQTEKELAYADIDTIEARNTKLPSRADMDKFAKNGLTTYEEYIDVLEARGYSNYWAEKYWTMSGEK